MLTVFLLSCAFGSSAFASPEGFLHPADCFTAHTLNRGEWVFNFPLTPGWVMWGLNDRITVEIDAECWLGGVPSLNGRFKVLEGGGLIPSMAFESMYQYLPDTVNLLEDYDYLNVRRQGSSWFNRINMSWPLSDRLGLHLSPGVTWSESLEIDNGDRPVHRSHSEIDLVEGDFSAGVSWAALDWMSLHASASSGVTFVYLDNVPGKRQLAAGVRLEPFQGMSQALLRNMGAELAVVSFSFPKVEESVTGPMFYLYWQFR